MAPTAGDFESIIEEARHRVYRKRVYARVPFTLAEGVHIALGVYHSLYKAHKPSGTYVVGSTQQPVRSVTRNLDPSSGVPLAEHDLVRYAEAGVGKEPIMFRDTEPKDIKVVLGEGRGLRLMGFKPAAAIVPFYNVGSPYFLYPSELDVGGSTLTFRAMHARMLARNLVAIARMQPRNNAPPRFVALQAAPEEKNEEGVQTRPPGMFAIQLPYADDIRSVALDRPPVAEGEAEPPRSAVAATAAVIRKLTFTDSIFDIKVHNPALQKFMRGLESIAIGASAEVAKAAGDEEEADALDQYKARVAWDEITEDTSMPDTDMILRVTKAAVGPGGEKVPGALLSKMAAELELDTIAGTSGATVSRGAAGGGGGGRGVKRARVGEDEEGKIDWAAVYASGSGVTAYTITQLKSYCKDRGLLVGGKKDELVARVMADMEKHFGAEGGGAAAAPPPAKRARK